MKLSSLPTYKLDRRYYESRSKLDSSIASIAAIAAASIVTHGASLVGLIFYVPRAIKHIIRLVRIVRITGTSHFKARDWKDWLKLILTGSLGAVVGAAGDAIGSLANTVAHACPNMSLDAWLKDVFKNFFRTFMDSCKAIANPVKSIALAAQQYRQNYSIPTSQHLAHGARHAKFVTDNLRPDHGGPFTGQTAKALGSASAQVVVGEAIAGPYAAKGLSKILPDRRK
ncbi:hypothetical protein FRC08_013256 [Ceratobasidium sp. 394]|nr:hypothetical protein FRC08_013256 [Ceratobasidium sp. 394]